MKAVIIGAGGMAGAYLVRRLEERGYNIIPVFHDTPLPGGLVDLVIDCNGDSRRFWAEENPLASFQSNVLSVASRLAKLRYGTYIYLSSVDVYGKGCAALETSHEDAPISAVGQTVYGFHKYLAEQMVQFHATEHLILRLGTLIGLGLKKNPVFDALNGFPLRQTPESTLNLVTLEMMGGALVRFLEDGLRGTYNVAASAPITVESMRREIAGWRGVDPESIPFHENRIATRYDVSIEKISQIMTVPGSQTMLQSYISRLEKS